MKNFKVFFFQKLLNQDYLATSNADRQLLAIFEQNSRYQEIKVIKVIKVYDLQSKFSLFHHNLQ